MYPSKPGLVPWFRCLALLCMLPGHLPGQVAPEPADIEFAGGGNVLQGRFFPAGNPGAPTILLLPDLPDTDVRANGPLGLGTALSEAGINVLTFNYRGTHGSEGFFTLAGVDQDLAAARRWLRTDETRARFDVDPESVVVGGYGVGGGLAIAHASTDLNVTEVFSISGFDQAVAMDRYAGDPVYARALDAALNVSVGGNEAVRWERGDFFAFIKEAMQSTGRWDLKFAAPQLARKRLLLVAGLDDARVPIEDHVLPLYRVLRGLGTRDLELVVYQDNHSFGRARDELAQTLADWILE